MRDYAETGKHLGPLPAPGVFARHNAVDTPALLPDGTRGRVVGLAGAGGPRHGALAPALADDIEESSARATATAPRAAPASPTAAEHRGGRR